MGGGSGTITVDDFVDNCFKLKGSASSLDVALLGFDLKMLRRELAEMHKLVQNACSSQRPLQLKRAGPVGGKATGKVTEKATEKAEDKAGFDDANGDDANVARREVCSPPNGGGLGTDIAELSNDDV